MSPTMKFLRLLNLTGLLMVKVTWHVGLHKLKGQVF